MNNIYCTFINEFFKTPFKAEDILTGFIADESKFEAYGGPVGVTVMPDGPLLVADDSGGKVWRVTAKR